MVHAFEIDSFIVQVTHLMHHHVLSFAQTIKK